MTTTYIAVEDRSIKVAGRPRVEIRGDAAETLRVLAGVLPLGGADSGVLRSRLGRTLGRMLRDAEVERSIVDGLSAPTVGGKLNVLQLDLGEPWQHLPWEWLANPDGAGNPLQERCTIVRILRANTTPAAVDLSGRVVVAGGNVPGMLAPEASAIRGLYRELDPERDVTVLCGATREDLRIALATPCSLLHLFGHGGPQGDLELADGMVPVMELSKLASHRVTGVVFLNACGLGEPTVDLEALRPTGAVLAAGVPHAIGWSTPIQELVALNVARAWHRAFIQTSSVYCATSEARRTLDGLPGQEKNNAVLIHTAQP